MPLGALLRRMASGLIPRPVGYDIQKTLGVAGLISRPVRGGVQAMLSALGLTRQIVANTVVVMRGSLPERGTAWGVGSVCGRRSVARSRRATRCALLRRGAGGVADHDEDSYKRQRTDDHRRDVETQGDGERKGDGANERREPTKVLHADQLLDEAENESVRSVNSGQRG